MVFLSTSQWPPWLALQNGESQDGNIVDRYFVINSCKPRSCKSGNRSVELAGRVIIIWWHHLVIALASLPQLPIFPIITIEFKLSQHDIVLSLAYVWISPKLYICQIYTCIPTYLLLKVKIGKILIDCELTNGWYAESGSDVVQPI